MQAVVLNHRLYLYCVDRIYIRWGCCARFCMVLPDDICSFRLDVISIKEYNIKWKIIRVKHGLCLRRAGNRILI